MSGITDPPKPKRVANYEDLVQGSTAGQLADLLATIPRSATVVWIDSYTEEARSFGEPEGTTTVAIKFKWPAS